MVGGPILVVPLVGGLVLDTAIQEVSSPWSSRSLSEAYCLAFPVFDVLLIELSLFSPLGELDRVIELVLVVLVVGHLVLDFVDGGRIL